MDIVNQIYNSLYKNRDEGTKTRSAQSVAQAGKSGEARGISMAALNPGDIFQGEVTDVKGQDLSIRLADGSTMRASMSDQMAINIGDSLQFMVKESSAEQLILKVVPNQEREQMSAVAERALIANGFSLSEKNGNIAMALMDAGEPLDKANIMKLLQQSYRFPDADIHTLVSMNRLGIPVTEGNISQYESYQNGTYQMSVTLNEMSSAAAQAFSEMANDSEVASLIEVNNLILDIVDGQDHYVATDGLDAFRQMMETEYEKNVVSGQELSSAVDETGLPVTSEQTTLEDTREHVTFSNSNLSLSEQETMSLYHAMTEAGFEPEQVRSMLSQADGNEMLLRQLSSLLQNMSEKDIRGLLQTEGYQSLVERVLKGAFSMHPEKMKDAEEIDDFYNRLLKDSRRLSAALDQKGAQGETFQKQSGQMEQQLKFLHDLNQNFIYAQLPVELSDQVMNSELFVYADKKRLAEKKDETSVLLHLDMEHLGPTDVYVSLSGQKVHAVFTMQDQKSVRIVASNMTELAERLREKGLVLSHEVKKKPEPLKSPVVTEIINPDAEKSVKRYNFDVRM